MTNELKRFTNDLSGRTDSLIDVLRSTTDAIKFAQANGLRDELEAMARGEPVTVNASLSLTREQVLDKLSLLEGIHQAGESSPALKALAERIKP